MTNGYATIEEVRNFTNVGNDEFNNESIQSIIDAMTTKIDKKTGRTWQEITTVTEELYDGDGTDTLWLHQIDLDEITALLIDDGNGTFTSITVADYIYVYAEGYIVIDSEAEVSSFTQGNQTVKLTYTYGSASPTDDVKLLCISMVANFMKNDPERAIYVKDEIQRLKKKVGSG